MHVFKVLSELKKKGAIDDALGALRTALRRGELTQAMDLDRAGRILMKELSGSSYGPKATKVHVFGQCTTTLLLPSLAAHAFGRGLPLALKEAEYDNVMQGLLELKESVEKPAAIVLMPWHQRLFAPGERPFAERIEEELAFWRNAWSLLPELGGPHLVQVGYDYALAGSLGVHLSASSGEIAAVRALNAELRRAMPRRAYFVDLEHVSGWSGRSRFYDARNYHWTKQPFSAEGASLVAAHLFAGLRALISGPQKVLVLDLDNTIWGGVVGETGPLGIALGDSPEGEAFRAFQRYAKGLTKRGVLLAVASKNNPADAREPFEKNQDMVLALDDFAAFEASWEPKSSALQRIAESLNLGLDSFVFFDDNPVEREEIRQSLPEVEVVEVPADPADYARVLEEGLYFETVAVTGEDLERREQYVSEQKRRTLQEKAVSGEDYLRSLEMCAIVKPIDESDLLRVVQLIGKTNQFNLTTRRHSLEHVKSLVERPEHVHLSMRLKDRFGDYGLIAVIIGVPAEESRATILVDTWLMSCRAIGRTAEHHLFDAFVSAAKRLGYQRIAGEYLPTPKNTLVAELYPSLGLSAVEGKPGRFEVALDELRAPVSFISAAG